MTKIYRNERWKLNIMMYFPIGILYPQVNYWGHMSPASLGRFYCLGAGWGIQSKGINSPKRGYMRNTHLWMIAMHLTLADKTAANWWKCDTLAKDQAQSVLCPMSGIECISCRRASIYVDSRVFVSFVSTGFGCSTRISEELFVVVVTHFAA